MEWFIWGLAAGLAAECLIHFLCDRLSRKAAANCGFDCSSCAGRKNNCAGYYCFYERHKADVTIEGE